MRYEKVLTFLMGLRLSLIVRMLMGGSSVVEGRRRACEDRIKKSTPCQEC
jgi:hypothetical protein